MKRMALMAALVLAGMIGGCDHKDSVAQYNPQLDGLLPHPAIPPDETILENQRKLYDTMIAANGGIKPAAAAPAPSGGATTTPAAAEGGAATPEGEGAPATTKPAAPAGGEGATPLPPAQ